jgi:hypothetical protein
MGLTESRADGGRNLSLEALEVVEGQAVSLIGIAAPRCRDMKLAVFLAAPLKFPREVRRGAEDYRL